MIRHLFKLIWNRKRSNFLMITEIFISFFVMFMALMVLCYISGNYFRPLGFSYEDVWILTMDFKNSGEEEIVTALQQYDNIFESYPEVEHFSLSNSMIFMPDAMNTSNHKYEDREISSQIMQAGDDFHKVLGVEILTGRWFDEGDRAAAKPPVVINYRLRDELFGTENPLGKTIVRSDKEYTVIGVVGEFRRGGELTGSIRACFYRFSCDTEAGRKRLAENIFNRYLIKVRPGTGLDFEEKMLKDLGLAGKNFTLKAEKMEETRRKAFKKTVTLPIILLIISGFLISNVALGLFGVIWYNINRRRSEIGLRRAMGASVNNIYQQIIGEVSVITTFGVIIGSFFALQFPLLNLFKFISTGTYMFAFVLTLLFIYLITLICSLYPSRLAAAIDPAAALHEE
ncbi:MAG: ABC transporter permease [FCB group bacterium]|nr:ABC transporter permease [FCB group bacterium]